MPCENYQLYQFSVDERVHSEPAPDDAIWGREIYQSKVMRLDNLIKRGWVFPPFLAGARPVAEAPFSRFCKLCAKIHGAVDRSHGLAQSLRFDRNLRML
ncbi:hypothetical protein EEB11_01985 [Pseudotabrizicola sediminis]|uniref:Uncharacterized protein n=1 Tax=Pseudotabrizicola sediminis TaxID=2486418 RepID=A0ABY2KW04_9RHOB|nr:hypothetical protein EEB11_01985 [Pseudotabrizicola sediminis]